MNPSFFKEDEMSFSDTPHGPPTANISNRHVGDLGNLTTDDNGTIVMDLADSIIQLFDNTPQFIGNRTLILHAMRDDGGKGGFPDSNSTGYSHRFLSNFFIS